jgi:hypothetical protein
MHQEIPDHLGRSWRSGSLLQSCALSFSKTIKNYNYSQFILRNSARTYIYSRHSKRLNKKSNFAQEFIQADRCRLSQSDYVMLARVAGRGRCVPHISSCSKADKNPHVCATPLIFHFRDSLWPTRGK